MIDHGSLGLPDVSSMPQTGQTAAIVVGALLAAASLTWAVIESRRREDLLPVFVAVGAGLTVVADPLLALLVGRAYPSTDQVTVVSTFGVDVPLFMAFVYVGLLPLGAYLLLPRGDLGVQLGAFWTVWLFAAVGTLVAEVLTLWLTDGVWGYAGEQSFVLGDVPLLTPITYVSAAVVVAGGVCLMERFLARSLHWLALLVTPMLVVAGHTMGSLPLAVAVNSTDHDIVLALGALGSAAAAVVIGYLVAVSVRHPWLEDAGRPHALDLDRVRGAGRDRTQATSTTSVTSTLPRTAWE